MNDQRETEVLMTTSFNDLDLRQHRGGDEPGPDTSAVERLAKQKDEIANKVANAAEEIERLRLRQEELEYAKKALHELNRKQDSYAHGKKEIIASLARSILQMEKDEVRASRMVELLSTTRQQFKGLLAEIRAIREERWAESEFEEELDRSLALIENARMAYNKSVAKIDAESWSRGERAGGSLTALEDGGRHPLAGKGFLFWLKVGIALTLPAIFVIAVLGGLLIWLSVWH